MAAMSLWIANLPRECDLNHLDVAADGAPCRLTYLGEPPADGVSQLNAALPPGVRTGLVPVEVHWLGQPVAPAGWLRIMPAGPAVPRVQAVTDGVNLLSDRRVTSGSIKAVLSEVERPEEFEALVDGRPVREIEHFGVDPMEQRYEFNFRLPEGTPPGGRELEISLGRRRFAPIGIEVA
jgi:hypothetical protein